VGDPEYAYERQRVGGFRTLLGVPLLREGSPIGTISLGRNSVRPFTDKQIELVTTFADQAVIAIENVRLFEAEQQRTHELSESLERQTATSEVLSVALPAILSRCLQPCWRKLFAYVTPSLEIFIGGMVAPLISWRRLIPQLPLLRRASAHRSVSVAETFSIEC
jgi:hypothetical protein